MTTPEALLAIENKAVEDVAGHWKVSVEDLKKAVLLTLALHKGEDISEVVPQIETLIKHVVVPQGMDGRALKAIKLAHEFGIALAKHGLGWDTTPTIPISKNAVKGVAGFDKGAVNTINVALGNLSRPLIGKGHTAILTAIAPVLQHPAKVEAATAWAVNHASNSAVSKIALATGETMVWISERNACITCISLSGVRSTSIGFPKDHTFGAKPMPVYGNTLLHPPRHPRCRCTVELGITPQYAEALQREAIRSVLKGWHLPSESEKIRIDAAQRLLDKHPAGVPASVEKYSRNAIKKGKFV